MPKFLEQAYGCVRLNKGPSSRARKLPEHRHEATKIIVHTSTSKAFQRCLVHILPICTTITILIVNVQGLFVGSDFIGPIKSETINLMLLQLAAKAHEILIVASLGLIVLQVIRQELLFGDGLPLGLVGSGLNFSNIGFFFKKEFYGALRYVAQGNTARKICFIGMLIVAGLVAALAGPASAVLLVPKAQTWPSGGTTFYLNGSSEQFWPEDLSGDASRLSSYCGTENSTTISICPGAGYTSLHEHWGRMNYSNFADQDVRSYSKGLSGSRFYWPVRSPDSLIPPLYALGNFRADNRSASNTFLVQPLAAVSTILERITEDWWNSLTKDKKMDPRIVEDRQVSALFVRTPLASIRCSGPQNLTLSSKTVQLPIIESRFTYSRTAEFNFASLNSTGSQHLRFSWVHLPDEFGAASIGSIFESPWTSDNQSRVVIGCTAQLGWIPTTLYTDEYTFWSGWYPWNLRFGDRTPSFTDIPPGAVLQPTNGRVALNDEWLNLLTPPIPSDSPQPAGRQPTTIENILKRAGFEDPLPSLREIDSTHDWHNADRQSPGRTAFLEAIIASVLVDGLSRTSSYRVFNTNGPASQWSLSMYEPKADFSNLLLSNNSAFVKPDVDPAQLTILRADMLISGFSFQGSLAVWLSMTVLLVHLLMASVHTGWIFLNRHSSWSWSSVSELITLCHNSTPTVAALKNTGSGIEKAITFSRVARIRVRSGTDTQGSDCVELIFDEEAIDELRDNEQTGHDLVEMHPQLRKTIRREQRPSRLVSAVTWPGERQKSGVPEIEVTSRSSSSERLIPQVYMIGSRNRESVKVDQAYG